MSDQGQETLDPTARIAELESELARARDESRLLSSILMHAPDFLTHITPEGRFLFLNRFAAGYGPDDVRQSTIYDFTDPAYHDIIRATIARTVETQSPQSYESIAVGDNETRRFYYNRIAPMSDASGEVTSLVLIATDVTRLKEAEAAYAESQAMLRHVLAATGMGIWWWDRERDVGGYDDAMASIVGFSPDEGHNIADVMTRVHPDDRERVLASLDAVDDVAGYGPLEHRVVRPDGEVRWVSASGRVLTTGGSSRLVGGAIDITERKRLEEQLAQSQKMESIGKLAGGIAHDFNNMLTAILAYSKFARAAVPEGSRIARDITEIERAAERSAALTSQLLAFARQQRIQPKVSDLNSIVSRVDSLLRRVLGADVEVATLLQARGRVKIDANQFEQVILNLTSNARDAMPVGGRLTIETADVVVTERSAVHTEVPPGSYVTLAVTDTGVGIPPALRARIFEPFFTTKESGKGTGLGLATCYGIVAQNHGRITVDSEPGRGSTFRVYLPRVENEAGVEEPVAGLGSAGGSETILVVEDEPSVRAVTVKTLQQLGYQVLDAINGSEALAIARDHAGPIHLLVTDVVMPQLSGTQLAVMLAKARPELAVLFVSGYPGDAVIREPALDREVDFLDKPYSPALLAERVRRALDRRS